MEVSESEPLCNTGEETTWYKYRRVFRKICTTNIYKRKLVATLIVYFVIFSFAVVYILQGTGGLALQLMMKVDLKTFSWVYSVCYIGYMVGCGLHSICHKIVINSLLLVLYGIVGGACTIATPLCPNFLLMLIIRFIAGVSFGGTETAVHDQLFSIWGKESGPFNQFQYVVYSLGASISTFSFTGLLGSVEKHGKNSTDQNGTLTSSNIVSGPEMAGNMTNKLTEEAEQNVKLIFLLTGCLSALAGIPYLIEYSMFSKDELQAYFDENHKRNSPDEQGSDTAYANIRLLHIFILICFVFIVTGVIAAFQIYLTTFLIQCFNWKMEVGTLITSAYFGASIVGNVFFVILSLFFGSKTVLIICITAITFFLISLCLSSLYIFQEGIFISICGCGFIFVSIWPAMYTFIEENIAPFSGKFASLCLFTGGLGMILHPLLLGYTMNILSPMWFVNLSLIEWLIIIILAYLLVYALKHKHI